MVGKDLSKAINLPVVDYSKVVDTSNVDGRHEEALKLINAFTEFGFVTIRNIEGYNEAELFESVKWFYYDVTAEERRDQLAIREFNPKNENLYRGIFPLIEGKLSYKEGYDMGAEYPDETSEETSERNKNPFLGDTPKLKFSDPQRQEKADKFYEVMYRHRKLLQAVGDDLMSLIAEAGNEKSDFFADMFHPRPFHTLRTIMYPQRRENIPPNAYLPDGRIISTPAHQDSGFLTLLQTFGFPGLEIQLGDEWYSVQAPMFPTEGGTLVVNVGEQLSAMSNERFKATIHRVLDIGKDRFSMPFFYEPCMDALISRKLPKALLLSEGNTNQPDISYGSFLLNKLPIYTEWSKLLEMLPKEIVDKYLGQRKVKISNWASKAGIETDGICYDDQVALNVA